ncbi:flagellar filament capping protein FliD [Brevibacillus laterosporus]|uniref:flagellar filament capping protein FliD n=1 Tax=Brevibacillus laterosporus TaxID=1465 RepID=UPI00036E1028|nr:flagellar filament capping protein FliD [Brevibacillus laterosporus]ATO49118.1 flagellar hook-associated protein [Brevibacillus laterosporus DSM 25]MBG9803634.1 flagellar hook-associated protein [Brevibacillus laterosporus]MED2003587.1 flagellar filament capping protein FliD [Brevibacillus laterosporus]MED4763203.1 flagellar filament capping protein FliD [Brevibacillus laterosporus]TPH19865.1 flagellar hook-associated protein [Brevibacillus laterosporus]
MASPIRLSGLASGIDTETMINKLMKVERSPMEKLLRKRQKEEWVRDSYREQNALLLELNGKIDKLRLTSAFTKQKLSSSDDAKVTASITKKNSTTQYDVTNVELAKPGTGVSVKFKVSDDIKDSSTEINSAFDFTIQGNDGSGEINIAVGEKDTIDTILNKINSESSNTGVKAFYSSTDKSIVFTSQVPPTEGNESQVSAIKITTSGGDNKLNIVDGEIKQNFVSGSTTPGKPNSNYTKTGFTGKDVQDFQGIVKQAGKATVNGVDFALDDKNTLDFDGISFTFKDNISAGDKKVVISTAKDTESVMTAIKEFVDTYNKVIDKFNGKLTEKVYRDFQPLLDEEREEMKEKQIENWEEKAKSGLLKSDSILSDVLNQMRSSFYSPVDGVEPPKNTLASIGIGTKKSDGMGSKFDYMENGKIHIDEDKLRDALLNDQDKVIALFTNGSGISTGSDSFKSQGLAQRIYSQTNAAMKKIGEKAGKTGTTGDNSLIGKDIRDINTRIKDWEKKLKDKETNLWKKYSAMEQAINKLNSQGSNLLSNFGG